MCPYSHNIASIAWENSMIPCMLNECAHFVNTSKLFSKLHECYRISIQLVLPSSICMARAHTVSHTPLRMCMICILDALTFYEWYIHNMFTICNKYNSIVNKYQTLNPIININRHLEKWLCVHNWCALNTQHTHTHKHGRGRKENLILTISACMYRGN